MAFKVNKAVEHLWKGKSNEAVNSMSTNVDVNKSMLTRGFSDKAFGGQKQMEGVMQAIDKKKKPWKYDEARRTQVQAHDAKVKEYDEMLSKQDLPEADREFFRNQQKSEKEALLKLQNTRKDDDPGFWNTTKEVGKGTFGAMNAGTTGQVAAKWGAAVGAGVVINGTGRAATGGGVTYNSSGQRDIMGVPLI